MATDLSNLLHKKEIINKELLIIKSSWLKNEISLFNYLNNKLSLENQLHDILFKIELLKNK